MKLILSIILSTFIFTVLNAMEIPNGFDPTAVRDLDYCLDTNPNLLTIASLNSDSDSYALVASDAGQGLSLLSTYTNGQDVSAITFIVNSVIEFSGEDPSDVSSQAAVMSLDGGVFDLTNACTEVPASGQVPAHHKFSYSVAADGTGSGDVGFDVYLPLGPGTIGSQEVDGYTAKTDVSFNNWQYVNTANKLALQGTLLTVSANVDGEADVCVNGICIGSEGLGAAVEWVENADLNAGGQVPVLNIPPDFQNFEWTTYWVFDQAGANNMVWDPALRFKDAGSSSGSTGDEEPNDLTPIIIASAAVGVVALVVIVIIMGQRNLNNSSSRLTKV